MPVTTARTNALNVTIAVYRNARSKVGASAIIVWAI